MSLEHASEFGLSEVSAFLMAPERRGNFPREQIHPRRLYAASPRTAEGHESHDKTGQFATRRHVLTTDLSGGFSLSWKDFHMP